MSRVNAARELGIWDTPLAAPALAAALKDAHEEVVTAAAEELAAGLKHGDSRIREAVLTALSEIGSGRALDLLGAALDSDDSDVMKAAASALGGAPDNRATDILLAALGDSSAGRRAAAAEALDCRGWRPANATQRALAAIAWGQWKEVEEMGARAGEALALALDFDGDTPQHAVEALGRIGDTRSVALLGTVLKTRGSVAAAEALGQIGDPSAVEPLLVGLGAQHPALRRACADALGRLVDLRAVEPLVAALRDRNREVRKSSAKALDSLGWKPANSVEQAYHAVACQDWQQAASLGHTAVPPLCAVLNDQAADVRRRAAFALGGVEDQQAIEALTELLEDADEGVRRAARAALESAEPEARARRLEVIEEARERCLNLMERLGLERALGEVALTTTWEGERARAKICRGVLDHLGLDLSDHVRMRSAESPDTWVRKPEYQAHRAALAGSPDKQPAIGVLTLMAVYSAPSGDYGDIMRALREIDDAWKSEPGCREWVPQIAAFAMASTDDQVKGEAIKMLEGIGDPAAVETLLTLARRGGPRRLDAVHALIPFADALRSHPKARAILEAAADPKNFDASPNLVRYAARALERMGEPVTPPALDVDWASIVEDQISTRDVQAILEGVGSIGSPVMRFYGAYVTEPAPGAVGPLLQMFDIEPLLALIHGDGLGHLFARTEILRTLARDRAPIRSYRQLVEEVRRRGFKAGYARRIRL